MEQQRKKWEAQMISPAFYGLNQEEQYAREQGERHKKVKVKIILEH
jgi:hypothetical protein